MNNTTGIPMQISNDIDNIQSQSMYGLNLKLPCIPDIQNIHIQNPKNKHNSDIPIDFIVAYF